MITAQRERCLSPQRSWETYPTQQSLRQLCCKQTKAHAFRPAQRSVIAGRPPLLSVLLSPSMRGTSLVVFCSPDGRSALGASVHPLITHTIPSAVIKPGAAVHPSGVLVPRETGLPPLPWRALHIPRASAMGVKVGSRAAMTTRTANDSQVRPPSRSADDGVARPVTNASAPSNHLPVRICSRPPLWSRETNPLNGLLT